jgi:outer membrane murein-binding lipoprotein Lpp
VRPPVEIIETGGCASAVSSLSAKIAGVRSNAPELASAAARLAKVRGAAADEGLWC